MTYSYTLLFAVITITVDKKDGLLSSVKAKQVHSHWHTILPLALYFGETFANVQKEEHTKMFTVVLFVIVKKQKKKIYISTGLKMLKWTVVFSYYGILSS